MKAVKPAKSTMTEIGDGATSNDGALYASERVVVAAVLSLIALLAATDLSIDLREGVGGWHVAAEAGVAAAARKYLDGLSQSIDRQLDQWQLSASEKQVAFLLLKGLSLKEIAAARRTTEKTARIQSSAIYAKSSLGGRSELSAFFLEDLLPPPGS